MCRIVAYIGRTPRCSSRMARHDPTTAGEGILIGGTPASISVLFVGSVNKVAAPEFAHSFAYGDVINRRGVRYLLGGSWAAITHDA